MIAGSPYGKVVHLVVAGQIGGAERFLVSLATRPEQSGVQHVIALMTPNPDLRALFVNAGLKVHDRGQVHENPVAYLWRSYGPRDLEWLGRVLAEESADVIHAHTYGSHVLAARAGLRFKMPVVRTEHGVRHYRDPTCALNRHWALRHTDRIVAVSAFVAGRVAAIAPHASEKITVVPVGVDTARFAPAPPPFGGMFTFAVIGRLEPVKRVHLAIEAVARVPGTELAIVGDGRERPRLESVARSLGVEKRVRFAGQAHDVRGAISACHAVINTTREEGLGLSVLEAAAMERPAVAFECGGVPEIVQDRRTGWLVPHQSVQALAFALAEASSDRVRAAQMGTEARRRMESRFGLDTMCAGYADVYRQVIERAAPTRCAKPYLSGNTIEV